MMHDREMTISGVKIPEFHTFNGHLQTRARARNKYNIILDVYIRVHKKT